MFLTVALFVVGIVLVLFGADKLVSGAICWRKPPWMRSICWCIRWIWTTWHTIARRMCRICRTAGWRPTGRSRRCTEISRPLRYEEGKTPGPGAKAPGPGLSCVLGGACAQAPWSGPMAAPPALRGPSLARPTPPVSRRSKVTSRYAFASSQFDFRQFFEVV